MPNLCSNKISIRGTEDTIKAIKDILSAIDNSNHPCVFERLVGSSDDNIKFWGTSGDVTVSECYFMFNHKSMEMFPETRWSPPIGFCYELSKRYNVEVTIIYFEPGYNFAGIFEMDSEGNIVQDKKYAYYEGLYHLDSEMFWDDIKEQVVFLLNQKDYDAYEKLIKTMDFVSDKDKVLIDKIQENVKEYIDSLK